MNYKRLGVIGGGNMARAIVSSAMNQVVWGDEICISNPSIGDLGLLRNQGIKLTTDNREAAAFGDVILLTVRLQALEQVLDEIEDAVIGKTVVSIVSGCSMSWLQSRLPRCHIICAMPNIPTTLGKGATAITPMEKVPERDYRFVSSIFLCGGGLFVVPAERMNQIIPVSAVSPAFFFQMADLMAKEAAKGGIEYNMALMMVAQTMLGSAEMLMKAGKSVDRLKLQVCTTEGAAVAGIAALEEGNLSGLVAEMFRRSIAQAEEAGK